MVERGYGKVRESVALSNTIYQFRLPCIVPVHSHNLYKFSTQVVKSLWSQTDGEKDQQQPEEKQEPVA